MAEDLAARLDHLHHVVGTVHRRLDALERQIEVLPHRLWAGLDDRVANPAPGTDVSRALQLAVKAFADTMFASITGMLEASSASLSALASASSGVNAHPAGPSAPAANDGSSSLTSLLDGDDPDAPDGDAPPPFVAPRLFTWSDGTCARYAPEDWMFPSRVNVRTMWDFWFHGDTTIGIGPFRFLPSKDLKGVGKGLLSQARRVILTMISLAIHHRFVATEDHIADLPPAEFDAVFDRAFHALINPPSNREIGEKPMVNAQRLARFSYQNVYRHFFVAEGSRLNNAPKLPPGWDMPTRLNCRDVWHLWYHGDRQNNVCPLKDVTWMDFNGGGTAGSRLGSARLVVESLVVIAVAEGFVASEDDLGEHMDSATLDTVFDNAYDMLLNYNPSGNLCGPGPGQLRGEKHDDYMYNSVAKAIRDLDKKRKRTDGD